MRLGWGLAQPVTPAAIDRLPDQREYLSLAESVLAGRGLQMFDARFGQTVWAYRTPGYPLLVAACDASPRAVRAVQAIVDTSTVLAVYLLARRLARGESAAPPMAASLVAVNPFLIYFSGLILGETVFTATLVWGTYLAVSRRAVAAGVVLTAGVLVRPSGLLLVPILVGAAVNSPVNTTGVGPYDWWRFLRAASTAAVILCVGLLPWAWRNDARLGRWVWTTTNGGITLYDGFNPAATGGSDQRFVTADPTLQPIIREGEVARSADLQRRAAQWAGATLNRLPALTLRKIARTWSPVPLSGEFGRPLYVLVSAAYAVPFDGLVLVGLFRRGLSRRAKVMLLLPAAYFTAVHAMTVGSLRYRVPVEPLLAVVAGSIFLVPSPGTPGEGFS